MCRIAAYQGPDIPLEQLIVAPPHSLLQQSMHAAEAKLAVNGDGFGMAWYGADTRPGLYRDVLPAWADDNLIHLCRMIRSGLFLSHVRASTMGETSRANCHPFAYRNWSFCHNGQIPHFKRIKRRLETALPDPLYHARGGSTDSEMLFLTLLAQGVQDDPARAVTQALAAIGPAGDEGPIRITCVFSDGRSLYALRHASDGQCPTLYLSDWMGGVCLASEPLDGVSGRWSALDPDVLVKITDGKIQYRPLPVRA